MNDAVDSTTTGEPYTNNVLPISPNAQGWDKDVKAESTGGGSGGGGSMDIELGKLRSDVDHVQKDIGEIKGDLRSLLWGGIIGLAILGGSLGGAMYYESKELHQGQKELTVATEKISSKLDLIGAEFKNINLKLDQLNTDNDKP